jgi:hypothetical protein
MDIIVLHENIYSLITLNYDFNFEIMNCFDYCDAFREAMSTYKEEINKWVMKDGRYFFGCMCN